MEYSPLQNDEIIYLGKKYKIKFVKDTFQYTVFSENLMKITFHVKDRRSCKRNIVNWYRDQTKKLLDNKVPLLGEKVIDILWKSKNRKSKIEMG